MFVVIVNRYTEFHPQAAYHDQHQHQPLDPTQPSFQPSASSFPYRESSFDAHRQQGSFEEPKEPEQPQDYPHPFRENVNANFGLDADAPEFQPGQFMQQQQQQPRQEPSGSSFTAGAAEFYPMGHPNHPSNRQ